LQDVLDHEADMSKHKWVDVEVLPTGQVVKVGRKLFLLTPSAQFLVRVKRFVKGMKASANLAEKSKKKHRRHSHIVLKK